MVTTWPQSMQRLPPVSSVTDKPSLICCKTIIGKGAPTKQGTEHVHGAALGEKEIAATRAALPWPYPPFEIPENIYAGRPRRDHF